MRDHNTIVRGTISTANFQKIYIDYNISDPIYDISVIYFDEGRKFDKDITVGLISSELLNLAEYNVHMAKLLDKRLVNFPYPSYNPLVINDSRAISKLHNLVDALAKLAPRPGSPESLQQLVEIARNPTASAAALSGITVGKEDTNAQSRNEKATGQSLAGWEDYDVADLFEPDPAGFEQTGQEQCCVADTSFKFRGTNDAACDHYVLKLQWSGLLKGGMICQIAFSAISWWLFSSDELSVSHCLSSWVISSSPHQLHHQLQPLSVLAIDIYAKLVFSIVKFCHADQGSSKLYLVHKVLVPIEKFFNLLAIFQIIHHPLLDLISLDHVFDGASFQVLTSLANAFHALQPLKVPGFRSLAAMPEVLLFFHELKDDFAWLPVQNLLLHILLQKFHAKIAHSKSSKGVALVSTSAGRLVPVLGTIFEECWARGATAADGTLLFFFFVSVSSFIFCIKAHWVLLVLLHDFPEFLCDHHFSFCDVIPPSCIQMRNIILSAFPCNMRLPDPSTPILKFCEEAVNEWNQDLNEVTEAKKRAATKGSPWL
ncbi:unnamed protein product [Ilex paraguariensis]|uniref:Uncharacterized protein n=1 Tax=Ilex paraguariensis TaxID=185542 RepID=A0ABC8UK20_9AQUA